mmetsp:Transcript_9936/g.14975  ORF Transcript_9936/g.14975 Transcript_9936/m.14975 type:complete len:531 (+) Transcript_9936:42-1634(+)|eukprot:CAMPEP_0185017364 /NCGR_PEP_ID=MMETSP1103-20130426/325_1 /TAXON_ID=36769 /ORGANISM="Paraphysomonas bandaiensis, Strain Caron Lab Isolate" /LENGTH=530 /DNA_ID=CAMNT_0027546743 /DNA_START=27 /DNA_END=1622 /DNA_ORIENTATION=-
MKFLICFILVSFSAATDLDDYVFAPDDAFEWSYMGAEYDLNGTGIFNRHQSWTGYMVNMTSQKWLTDDVFADESTVKSVWWHILVVIVPSDVIYNHNASIYITGGKNTHSLPTATDEDIVLTAALAMETKTITSCLFQVPNQPIIFRDDPLQKSRSEDAVVAYTWDHYLKDTSETTWPLYFPMVKASLRAMDTTTAFIAKQFPESGYSLDYYTVLGASKRGWTTWLVGAVDSSRVVAICPIVLDLVNYVKVLHHQYRSYGGWSNTLVDYYENNITARFDDYNMTLLQAQIDMYTYKDRLVMPKLVVNAVLDEFQQPDDTRFWWDEMPGPKRFLMTPNADHSELTGILEVIPAIGTWVTYLLEEKSVPEFTWEISESDGSITVFLDNVGEVFEASVWYSYSCGNNIDQETGAVIPRRDFRLASLDDPCECGISAQGQCLNLKSFWTRELLEPEVTQDGSRVYTAHMTAPDDGRYVAYFIDVKYKARDDKLGRSGMPKDLPGRLEFTSAVSVWPNTFPYEDCEGAGCKGTLL